LSGFSLNELLKTGDLWCLICNNCGCHSSDKYLQCFNIAIIEPSRRDTTTTKELIMEIYLDLKTVLTVISFLIVSFVGYTVVSAFLAMFHNYVTVVSG